MGESLRKPHPMPEMAAFVQSLREAFGGTVDDAVAKGKRGEPGFADARTAVPRSVVVFGFVGLFFCGIKRLRRTLDFSPALMRIYPRESVECLERGTPYGLYGCHRTGRSNFQGYIGQALARHFIGLCTSTRSAYCQSRRAPSGGQLARRHVVRRPALLDSLHRRLPRLWRSIQRTRAQRASLPQKRNKRLLGS